MAGPPDRNRRATSTAGSVTEFARGLLAEAEFERACRAHAAHLAEDPTDICIPGFNDMPSAAVDFTDAPPDGPGLSFTVRLRHNDTGGVVSGTDLAHSRQCADASCLSVWDAGRQRRHHYGDRTFVLVANPRGRPFIVAVDEHFADIAAMQMAGEDVSGNRWFHAYEVTPATAEALYAGRIPDAAPLDRP